MEQTKKSESYASRTLLHPILFISGTKWGMGGTAQQGVNIMKKRRTPFCSIFVGGLKKG